MKSFPQPRVLVGRTFHKPQKVGQASRLPPAPEATAALSALALTRLPGRRDARPTFGLLLFMVPMGVQNRKEAFPKPAGSGAGVSPAIGASRRLTCRRHEVRRSFTIQRVRL